MQQRRWRSRSVRRGRGRLQAAASLVQAIRFVCARDELKPHLVVREGAEREVGEAGVTRAGAVVVLEAGDVAGAVGKDRSEAVAVVVGERQLG